MSEMDILRKDYEKILNLRHIRLNTNPMLTYVIEHLWKAEEALLELMMDTWTRDQITHVANCIKVERMNNEWQDDDDVTMTFATLKQTQRECYDKGFVAGVAWAEARVNA